MSPSSDIVGPSPVTSNGTDATEIEDELASEPPERIIDSRSSPPVHAWVLANSLQVKTPPSHQAPPMVNTKVKPVAYGIDAPTPQAQKLEDVIANDPSKLRSSSATSLECKSQ